MKILMIGVGGSGMRGLAYLLNKLGNTIWGVDKDTSVRGAKDLDFVNWYQGASFGRPKIDLVIYSDAVPAADVWRSALKAQGVREMPYHEAVADLTKNYWLIAVAGTHGKTSTSMMLAHIMIEANFDPTVLLGTGVKRWEGRNARSGRGKFFVLEADEFRDHFLIYNPSGVILTSVDFDHPDYFSDLGAVRTSFSKFLRRIKPDGWVITHKQIKVDNKTLAWPKRTYLAEELSANVAINYSGSHMRANAALAVKAAQQLGVERPRAESALGTLPSLRRRLERLGNWKNIEVFSDYGHHPAAIVATLQGLRASLPGQKILAIVEVHTPERLVKFLDQYAAALAAANGVVLTPVFLPAGRTKSGFTYENERQALANKLQTRKRSVWQVNWDNLTTTLGELADDFDVAIGFSAGDLDRRLRKIVKSE